MKVAFEGTGCNTRVGILTSGWDSYGYSCEILHLLTVEEMEKLIEDLQNAIVVMKDAEASQ